MFKKHFWLISALSFVAGLFLAHYFYFLRSLSIFLFFVFTFLSLLLLLKFKKIFLIISFFLFLAIWRYLLIFPENIIGRIENYNNHELIIVGQIISEPESNDTRQRIKLKIIYGLDEFNNKFKLKGKVLVSSRPQPQYNLGDFLKVSGKWQKPGIIEDFDYGLYLKRYGITAVSYYPNIKKINIPEKSFFAKNFFIAINNLKSKVADQFDFYLSLESSAILKAMLLGDKTFLSLELREKFSRAGISHIIAISGMHISLLSSLFLSFLLFSGLSRRQSFYGSILFLAFYLALIGAPASACRASLMGFLSFLEVYMGRAGNLVNVLFFSGIFLLLLNPLLLFGDLGFQLSFLAVLGIIYLHPIVKEILSLKIFKIIKINEAIVDILSITISVQLIAGPILISSFKQFSLIAPISNLLVVWLLPFIISFSIVAIFLSFIIPFLGQLLYLLIDLIIKYILFIGSSVNNIPGAFVDINNWSIYFSIIYYLILFYLIKKYKK
jgi:competence protein ComEC